MWLIIMHGYCYNSEDNKKKKINIFNQILIKRVYSFRIFQILIRNIYFWNF